MIDTENFDSEDFERVLSSKYEYLCISYDYDDDIFGDSIDPV